MLPPLLEFFVGFMPLYLLAITFFSYLIWSKFFNGGKLKFKEVDEVFQFVSLSLFFAALVVGIIFSLKLMFGFFELSFIGSPSEIFNEAWTTTKNVVLFVILLGVYALMARYKGENPNEEILRKKIVIFSEYFLICVLAYLAIYLWLIITPLRYFYADHIGTLIVLFIPIFFSVGIVNTVIFKKNPIGISEICTKKFFRFLKIGFPALIILSAIYIPFVNTEPLDEIGYTILSLEDGDSRGYTKVVLSTKIITFGAVPLTPVIPLVHKGYHISHDDFSREKGYISIEVLQNGVKKFIILEEGDLAKWELDSLVNSLSKKAIGIKFNKDSPNRDIQKINLNTFSKINFSIKSFSYSSNTEKSEGCNGDECLITLEINNQLKLPVNLGKSKVMSNLERGGVDPEKCLFDYFDITLDRDRFFEKNSDCSGNSCSISIYNLDNEEVVYLNFAKDKAGKNWSFVYTALFSIF